MTVSLESSLKKHLQLIAKERQIPPAEVWQNVILERFLVRLCASPYRTNFILKGGILLARHIDIGRETKDLDFSVDGIDKDVKKLQTAFEEIAAIPLDDGFEFKHVKLEALSRFHMQYPGAQIRLDACFGKSRVTVFIDLGFGDHIEVIENEFRLAAHAKGPLFEPTIHVKCYPLEFVFAEKLETVLFRGADNSRMKDFHDLYSMACKEEALNRPDTLKAIEVVFKHRNTPLNLPIQFDDAGLKVLQSHWQRYRPSIVHPERLPEKIMDVIAAINTWLQDFGGSNTN